MKKNKLSRRVCMLLITMIFAMSLVACNNSSDVDQSETATAVKQEATTASQETAVPQMTEATIRVLVNEGTPGSFPDSDSLVFQEIKNKTGATMEFEWASDDKFSVKLAAGDLPDMVRAQKKFFDQMIEGDMVLALDDLLVSNGQDILETIPDALEFSRKFWSQDQNKVYFIAPQIQTEAPEYNWENAIGAQIRWDLYTQAGYPEVGDTDELLQVLADIVEMHPETEEGKPMYGVTFAGGEGTMWPYVYPMAFMAGQRQLGEVMSFYYADMEPVAMLTDMNSTYWMAMDFYNKAYRLGILDPDCFLNQPSDRDRKVYDNKQVVMTLWGANKNISGETGLVGFMTLPLEWGYQWTGEYNPAGWADKGICISKSSEQPEKVMDVMNYFWSYEGSRTLNNGVQGVNWDYVNGTPQLTEETMKAYSEGGDARLAIGAQFDNNFQGIGQMQTVPYDGYPVSLFESTDIYTTRVAASEILTDYCKHYNVSWPGELSKQIMENNSNVKNQSSFDSRITATMSTAPDDILRAEAKLLDLAVKHATILVLSETKDEYDANKQIALDEFTAAGFEEVAEWYITEFNKAKESLS